jgi:hypothetical protein
MLFTACPAYDEESLVIINNTDDDILWGMEVDKDFSEYDYNPWITSPTGAIVSSMEEIKNKQYFIKAGDTCYFMLAIDSYKSILKKGVVRFQFFNYDSICNIPWQRVCDERILLKEVVFESWEELEECKFTIKIQ